VCGRKADDDGHDYGYANVDETTFVRVPS